MKGFDITEKIEFTAQITHRQPSLFCFGNYQSKSVFLNTLKLGTSTLKKYSNYNEYFWYVNIKLHENEIKIEKIIDHTYPSKHQINHIRKIFKDQQTNFYFIMKDPDDLFLSSFIHSIDHSYDHQIHSKYYTDTFDFEDDISSFFHNGTNTKPKLLIGYFNEIINKFPKKFFGDSHIQPKYIKYINFLNSCIQHHSKTLSNFKLLQINDIGTILKKEFSNSISEQFHDNQINTNTKHEFHDKIISQIDFKPHSISSLGDILISKYYDSEVSFYNILQTLLPTITFDDSENTDTDDISVNNNDKKDS